MNNKNPRAMQLNNLTIERNMYRFSSDNIPFGGISGRITFGTGEGHQMTLVLTAPQIQEILNVVAGAMVETTKELAQNMTREIIENTPLGLEPPTE